MRTYRIKSHQIGIDFQLNKNENKTLEKSTIDENKNLIVNMIETKDADENNKTVDNQNYSTSEDDTVSQFANSRTIIKP